MPDTHVALDFRSFLEKLRMGEQYASSKFNTGFEILIWGKGELGDLKW